MQLSSLRLIYVDKLEENGYPNSEYRSEKLMHRLQNHDISCNISFTKSLSGIGRAAITPTADDMTIKSDQLLPKELIRFINLVMNGKPEIGDTREKTRRLVLSIGQDVCRAVTDGTSIFCSAAPFDTCTVARNSPSA